MTRSNPVSCRNMAAALAHSVGRSTARSNPAAVAATGLVLAGGSQQTASIGASVIAAHRALVQCGTDVTRLRVASMQLAMGLAPPRRPMTAADLGTPLMERMTPPVERPLPADLDQPLAAFDPAAVTLGRHATGEPAAPRCLRRTGS